jgi:uncharacterized protein (UPF0548 family)
MTDLWAQPVSYAAVGATQAPDLLTHPPQGYRPLERRVRIGHGAARFDWACAMTMAWGIQSLSGFEIRRVDAPAEVTENTYAPVAFDAEGTAVRPASITPEEAHFTPDGTPYLKAGDTAVLGIPFFFWRVKAPARVVYVIDEPDRKGFAYGTMTGHPENGEEAFIVERQDDGSVWLRIRAFSRPASALWWVVYPVLRLTQEFFTRRYERALAGPIAD